MAVETISTVLVAATATAPANPYDLTTLAEVTDELGILANDSSNNARLSRYITQASTAINNYCKRVFQVEAVQDQIFIQQDAYPYQVPGGVYPLQLSRWPLVNTAVVPFTGNTHGTTTVDGIASTAGLTQGLLVFAADGSQTPGAQISTVNGPNSITLTQPMTETETGVSFTTGVQVIQTLAVGDTQTLVYGQDYTIDAARGWLIRLNEWTGVSTLWEALPVTVQYMAGYPMVPYDLDDAAIRLVTARYKQKNRDPMLVEQTQGPNLGTQRYWVGNTPGQNGAFPPEIESLLENYRVPTV